MFYLCLFQGKEEEWRTVSIDLTEAFKNVVSEPNQPSKGIKIREFTHFKHNRLVLIY